VSVRWSRLLCLSTAAALLSSCGGSQVPAMTNAVQSAALQPTALPHVKTFYFTGTVQNFMVPKDVKRLTVVMRGGGGAGQATICGSGGRGGRVEAVIPVNVGQRLIVTVGGAAVGATGGYNGGGDGGSQGRYGGGAGGGASDLREPPGNLGDRILVAAGGGGQGADNYHGGYYHNHGCGGAGGGLAGRTGGLGYGYDEGGGGDGGTQYQGGAGGEPGQGLFGTGGPGSPGASGQGGFGGSCQGSSCDIGGVGGGGGGGWYGGGGGGAGGEEDSYGAGGGGGGGGSSFIEAKALSGHTWTGWHKATGNGLVVLSW
jgi:hypothetical protein